MTHPHFNEAAWIARFADALEDVAEHVTQTDPGQRDRDRELFELAPRNFQ